MSARQLSRDPFYYRSPNLLGAIDYEFNVLQANPRWESLFRVTDVLNLGSFLDVIHASDRESIVKKLESLRGKAARSLSFECRIHTSDTTTQWYAWNLWIEESESAIFFVGNNQTEAKQSSVFLRQFQTSAKMGGWEIDLLSSKVFWTEEVHIIHGTDPRTYQPQLSTAMDFYDEASKARLQILVEGALLDPKTWDETLGIVDTKGNRVPVRVVANVEISDGKVTRLFGTIQDITEQKNDRTLLVESENRFKLLIDNAAGYAIFTLDLEGHIITWNAAAQAVKGYEEAEILGRHMSVFYPPSEGVAQKCKRELEIAARTGRFEEEGIRFRKGGIPVWSNVIIGRLNDENGKIIGFSKMIRDLTPQREAERTLKEFQDRFNFIATGIVEGIFEVHFKAKSFYMSMIGRELLGLSIEDEISYKEVDRQIHPDDREWVLRTRKEYLERRIPNYNIEFRRAEEKGKPVRWVNLRGYAIWDVDGNPIKLAGSLTDISEKKATEITLVNNAKMSSLGEMAGGIAHEINTPLNIIMGNIQQVQLLQTLSNQPLLEKSEARLQVVLRTVERMAQIVRGLRMISRDSSHDGYEKTSARQLIEETTALCRNRLQETGIELQIHLEEEIEVHCRTSEICQILLNLLQNSIDAIDSKQEKWVRIEAKRLHAGIEISVSDSGIRIAKNIETKLMQPFFTTKAVGKGVGIGLSISRGLARGHKGSLIYDSTSESTRFALWLPEIQSMERAA